MYTKDSFKDIDFEKVHYVEMGASSEPDIQIDKIKGTIKYLRIDNDCLVGELKILELANPEFVQRAIEDKLLVVRPKSLGHIQDDGTIKDATIVSFTIIPAQDDSFSAII